MRDSSAFGSRIQDPCPPGGFVPGLDKATVFAFNADAAASEASEALRVPGPAAVHASGRGATR